MGESKSQVVKLRFLVYNNEKNGGMYMNRDSIIIMKKQINVSDLAGEKVMIDFETGKYFLIKGVGNDIWDMLQEETSPGMIIDSLLKEYDVSEDECESSVIEFLSKLESLNFIDVIQN